MRVSFLKPPVNGILGLEMITFAEPLGLEYIAAALEADGHDCDILDLRIDGLRRGLARVRAFDPQIIGIQSTFTTERFRTFALARKLKKELPEVMVIVGGHDASRDPEWFMASDVDAVVVGDGESVMACLVKTIETGGKLTDVPGLVINETSGALYTPSLPADTHLDKLPFPSRHLVSRYAKHYYTSFCRPLALLETARGCPFKCNFCSVWKFHNGTYREKSPGRVLRELQQLPEPYIFITDDIFWTNPERCREIAQIITKSGIKKHFFIQTRSDIIIRHAELIEMWKNCGELTIFIGLEKIDDEGLKSINKRNTADSNCRALDVLRELGVGYTPNFIIDPKWDHDDFDRLRDWVSEMGAYNSGFSVLTPLPGTDLWNDVKKKLTTRDWELYDLEHAVLPTKLPLDAFYEEYAGLWRHALEIRHKVQSPARTYMKIAVGLATRKVTMSALRKGIRIGKVLGEPSTFLTAHRQSKRHLAKA